MTTTPITPERLSEIVASHQRQANALAVDHPVDLRERCDHRAISELLAEVTRLQGVVLRLANNERDLAETSLVLEQQDRDLERQQGRIDTLETGLREACELARKHLECEIPFPEDADRAAIDRLSALAGGIQSKETT